MSAVLERSSNGRGAVSQAVMLRDALEDEIVNGVLKPGDRLDEAHLDHLFPHLGRVDRRIDESRAPRAACALLVSGRQLGWRKISSSSSSIRR